MRAADAHPGAAELRARLANIKDLIIIGAGQSGCELANTLADADGLGTISYQWKDGGVDIDGATASAFTLTHAVGDATHPRIDVIEMKLDLTIPLIEQGVHWLDFADYVWVAVPALTLRDVTSVFEVTAEAAAAWENAPWS